MVNVIKKLSHKLKAQSLMLQIGRPNKKQMKHYIDDGCYCGDGQCTSNETIDLCPEDCISECSESVGNNACNFPDCNSFYDCADVCGGSAVIVTFCEDTDLDFFYPLYTLSQRKD